LRYLKIGPFFKNSNSNFEESSLGILGSFIMLFLVLQKVKMAWKMGRKGKV